MSYVKAEQVLPQDLVALIQQYIDGEYLYISRKATNKKSWGENTNARESIQVRNREIYEKYLNGAKVEELESEYFLSIKSLQRIVLQEKKRQVYE